MAEKVVIHPNYQPSLDRAGSVFAGVVEVDFNDPDYQTLRKHSVCPVTNTQCPQGGCSKEADRDSTILRCATVTGDQENAVLALKFY